jgi:hypothetical protein
VLVVDQASLLDGLSLDAFAFEQDGLAAAEIDVGRGEVTQALVVALVVIVGDEGLDLRLEVAGQVVVLEQNAVLQGLVPTLDLALCLGVLALCLGVAGRAADMVDCLFVQPLRQLAGDVAGPIVGQQARAAVDPHLAAA